MHELGILRHALQQVRRIAEANKVQKIKHITLEIGEKSGIVVQYLQKLYPIAAAQLSLTRDSELKISVRPGSGMAIKDIGY